MTSQKRIQKAEQEPKEQEAESEPREARLRLQVSDRARSSLGLTPSHRSCHRSCGWNPSGGHTGPTHRPGEAGTKRGSGWAPRSRLKTHHAQNSGRSTLLLATSPRVYFHQETKYRGQDTEEPILSTPITITCRTNVPLRRGPGCGARPRGGNRPPRKMNPRHSRTRGPTLPAGRASEYVHSRSYTGLGLHFLHQPSLPWWFSVTGEAAPPRGPRPP